MKICPQCESGYHDSYMTCPTHGGMLSEIRDLRAGMLIRDTYRIIKKLGKGGMGAVYLAQHTLMDEPRALKFLSDDLSEDGDFTSRFLREVRTLRQVRNRNVVDCGDPERAEDGSLFFSMEFVDGPNLRGFLKTVRQPMDVQLALDITHGIAEGLGAAHAKGLVHRDIKPDNILMAREGEVWVPKIADFGLVATKESGHQTRTGSMLLTMAYAAPEQWIGTRAADLDGRTDLYALGGVLFEMLTGQAVFDAESYHEWAQKHLRTAAPVPSSIRPALAKWKGLDALVQRLLAKDRKDRPQDVAQLLTMLSTVSYDPTVVIKASPRDKTTFIQTPSRANQTPDYSNQGSGRQDDETVVSTPPPNGGRGTNPPPAAKPSPAPIQNLRGLASPASPPPAARAPAASPTVNQPLASATNVRVAGSPAGGVQAGTITGPVPAEASASSAHQSLGRASRPAESTSSGAYKSIGRVSRSVPGHAAAKKGVPAWAWVVILLIVGGLAFGGYRFYLSKANAVTLESHSDAVISVAFSPNGLTLASASRDNTIQFWDVTTAKTLLTLPDHADFIAFSPDGRSLASADSDRNVKLWDVSNGQTLATFDGHTAPVLSVAFSPDGRMLASGSSDATIRLWDVTGDKLLRVLQGNAADINSVAFSPDGRTLASGGADNSVKLWDVTSGKVLRVLQGHSGAVNSVAFSPNGQTLATGSDDTTIKLWDVVTGNLVRTLQGHTGPVRAVAFSPDNRTLASGSVDTTVKLWDVTGPTTAVATLQGHSAAVQSVAFNQGGTILASGSSDKTTKLWDIAAVRN